MASQIFQFGQKAFSFQEFLQLTQYKEKYGRNVIAELSRKQILEVISSMSDKRARLYKLRWPAIKQLIIEGKEDKDAIINGLNLSQYEHQYIVIKNFEVIDHDIDLLNLVQRVFKENIDPDVVITNVGIPKQMIIYEIT
jgi:hypothetical protein